MVQAKPWLDRIGYDAGEGCRDGADRQKPSRDLADQRRRYGRWKKPYHRLPKLAPRGNDAIAACCASAARAGPSVITPGVACLTAMDPAPNVISAVVISAAADRVSA